MRIDRIILQDYPPIKSVDIRTSSNVVIVAGANGSGKTRLYYAIVQSFARPHEPQASLSLTATRQEEEAAWKSKSLEVMAGKGCPTLSTYLTTRFGAQSFVGTLVQIESNRIIRGVQFESFPLNTPDPDEQGLDYTYYLDSLGNRWNKLVNNIFKKAAIQDQKIAKFVKAEPSKPGSEALTVIPDPFLPYQDLFASLLPGKTLEPINPSSPQEFHYRVGGSQPLRFDTLSSGEIEVVTMAFDLVYKQIDHSVILIDEPELHLHPTLIFRLIETLKSFWHGTNQLILFTHSADLISTYFSTGDVFVIDSSSTNSNQAQHLSDLSINHPAIARAAGINLGMFAVGKRLVFVEGRDASVDRLVYHNIAQNAFPNSLIMPIGSVENINALRSVVDELTNAIFGIDLFLIRDRDGLSDDDITLLESNVRFRCLPRRHIENYLLDAEVLSKVANKIYLSSEQKDITRIREALHNIASSSIMDGVLSNVREHIKGLGAFPQPRISNINKISRDELAENISKQMTQALDEMSQRMDSSKIQKLVIQEHVKLVTALSSEDWVKLFPGKPIFIHFCRVFFKEEPERVREAYIDIAMQEKPEVFQDIIQIFQKFAQIATLY